MGTLTRRIAILGAGILGATLALLLVRRGHDVTLFDKRDEPVAGASHWHEGRIHLGYVYGGDATLRTAGRMLEGGMRFWPLMAELLECDLRPHATSVDDIVAVHRKSVVDAETLAGTFRRIDALIAEHPGTRDYLVDVSRTRARRLSPTELAALSGSDDIVAALEVAERSVNTHWLAERLAAALRGEQRIRLRLGATITAAEPLDGINGSWRVRGSPDLDESFDVVVNALWEGRLAVDRTAGMTPPPGWSHRYRIGLFVHTNRPIETRSTLVAVGPFGDVKNYNGRDFYLSWYPIGLVAESAGISLAEPAGLEGPAAERFIAGVRAAMAPLLPGVDDILDAAEVTRLQGGFVFAQEHGALDDPAASIHRRDRFGIQRSGNYFSVDTGKYSTAPWLAEQLADLIGGAL